MLDFNREDLIYFFLASCLMKSHQEARVILKTFSHEELRRLLLIVGWIKEFDHVAFIGPPLPIWLEADETECEEQGNVSFIFYGKLRRREVYGVNLKCFSEMCQSMAPRSLIMLAAYIVRKRVQENFPTLSLLTTDGIDGIEIVQRREKEILTIYTIFDRSRRDAISKIPDPHEQDRLLIGHLAAEACISWTDHKTGIISVYSEGRQSELKKILTFDSAHWRIIQ